MRRILKHGPIFTTHKREEKTMNTRNRKHQTFEAIPPAPPCILLPTSLQEEISDWYAKHENKKETSTTTIRELVLERCRRHPRGQLALLVNEILAEQNNAPPMPKLLLAPIEEEKK